MNLVWGAVLVFVVSLVAGLLFNDATGSVGFFFLYNTLGALLAALLSILGMLGGAVWRAKALEDTK